MPLDEEHLVQYATPLRCPDCSEQTFQTDARPATPESFVEAECTNCGHALTDAEIAAQPVPPAAFAALAAKYDASR